MQLPEHAWLLPSGTPALAEGEVHVWRANLDGGIPHVWRLAQTLSDAERARADKFLLARDRNRFIACRGILRGILSGYLETAADQVRFRYGDQGKPCLAQEAGARGLHFNLSHSEGMAVLVFTPSGEIGVDVERVRADVPWGEIAAHVFAPEERRMLESIPAPARPRACFALWTGKEAYVKARGQGLYFPLDGISVSLEPLALQRVARDEPGAARWCLQELNVGAAHVATVAVPGREWKFFCWEWPWQRV
jgi:4'-phosphopantetheinyl transferase